MRLLIKHGADVFVQDETHATPLHLAAFCGSFETVHLLLEHGADVTVLDGSQKTPLHLASSWVSAITAHYSSKKRGADVNGQDEARSKSNNPHYGKVETVRLLIEYGADVTAQDESHMTPLHLASFSCIPEIVGLLLERGACVTAQDKSCRTPLHLVSSWVSATVVTLAPGQCRCEWTGYV